MSKETKSILIEADEIINHRAQEKEREYGPMNTAIINTATVASEINGSHIDAQAVFAVLIALKLTRIRNSPRKRDNYLDAVAYIQALYNYENNGNE